MQLMRPKLLIYGLVVDKRERDMLFNTFSLALALMFFMVSD